MGATKFMVLLFILPSLIQSASKPSRKRSPKYQDIQELITNAEILRSYIKSTKLKYAAKCKCRKYPVSFFLIKQISEQTITRAVADVQRSLYPFNELLTDMTQEERNLKLKDKLQKIGKKLNETYDTAIDIMVKTGQSVKNLPKKTSSLKLLDQKTRVAMNKHGLSKSRKAFRNYFVLYELQRQAFDITYSLGKLNQLSNGK